MLFHELAMVFQTISAESSRTAITQQLSDLFTQASPHEVQVIAYLSLGLLRPPYQGTQFNIAEKSVKKIAASLLHLSDHELAAHMRTVGDLGDLIAQGSWKGHEHLTITAVYKELLALEDISGVGAQEERMQQLSLLLQKLDPLSAGLVVRAVLGRLRLGFSDMTIIDALSWMLAGNKSLHASIEHAYNVCADIGLIARFAKEQGIEGIKQAHIQVGIPIRPAAAERMPTARDIVEKLGDCVAQPKLDGFRLQIHIDKRHKEPHIYFFSRNLQDMSSMFPDLKAALLKLPVETLIMEGEAIVYDEQTGTFLPFQETVKRKRKHDIEEVAAELPLRFFAFDILYYNGESLLQKSHHARREILKNILDTHTPTAVALIGEKKIHTGVELENYFLENIAAGLEGLVVKRPDSQYQPGKRNFNWIKLKRSEEGHLDDTIDAVILGYYHGEGKRAQFGIGAFLIGVYDKKNDRFETIAKVGTGLKDEGWRDLKKKCDALKSATHPHNIYCSKELFPDVWVTPSLVCVVRADEITRSPVHTAGKTEKELGFALRFPRFVSYRSDKSPELATSVDEIKHLFEIQK